MVVVVVLVMLVEVVNRVRLVVEVRTRVSLWVRVERIVEVEVLRMLRVVNDRLKLSFVHVDVHVLVKDVRTVSTSSVVFVVGITAVWNSYVVRVPLSVFVTHTVSTGTELMEASVIVLTLVPVEVV